MKEYNCIIIEDEPLAAGIIEDYVCQIHFLNLIEICPDAIYAIEIMRKHKVDLIFLDIHLPKLKGLDFLKTLKNPPQVIITTAYNTYAIDGYEHNVLDYLMKPIDFSRFLKAINKLKNVSISTTSPSIPSKSIDIKKDFIFFNVEKKKVKVYMEDIIYIESDREYVKIYTSSKVLNTKIQIKQIEVLLKKNHFIRIHRSFIVAKSKIEAYSASYIEVHGNKLPIGRSYKEMVLMLLEKE